MNIAIYAEGGIGDCLLAHHKTWILKETLYPDAEFSIFLDTEGNKMQARVLKHLFPNFYKEVFTIPHKKYKKLIINSQFGEEEVKGFIENLPQEWRDKIQSYDKKYNFHIDSLEFLKYPELQWAKYHRLLPYPELKLDPAENMIGDYFLSNLWSATGTEHRLEQFWSDRLILELDELAEKLNYRHLIISTPELNEKYAHLIPKLKKSMILNTELEDVCNLIGFSKGIIGIDSAWRLIGHMFNKPTVTISKNCRGVGGVPPSHYIRWLINPETTVQMEYPTGQVIKLFSKVTENQLYQFFPQLALTDSAENDILIKRDYTVNEEKSVLN